MAQIAATCCACAVVSNKCTIEAIDAASLYFFPPRSSTLALVNYTRLASLAPWLGERVGSVSLASVLRVTQP